MSNGKKAIERVLDALQAMDIPWAYRTFRSNTYLDEEGHEHEVKPPFAVYYGSGQNKLSADNTHYWSEDTYNIEYYFTDKNSTKEEGIEAAILAEGFQFQKSEDIYLDEEDVFVIYYYLN